MCACLPKGHDAVLSWGAELFVVAAHNMKNSSYRSPISITCWVDVPLRRKQTTIRSLICLFSWSSSGDSFYHSICNSCFVLYNERKLRFLKETWTLLFCLATRGNIVGEYRVADHSNEWMICTHFHKAMSPLSVFVRPIHLKLKPYCVSPKLHQQFASICRLIGVACGLNITCI